MVSDHEKKQRVEIGDSDNKKWPLITKVANGGDWREWQQEVASDYKIAKD